MIEIPKTRKLLRKEKGCQAVLQAASSPAFTLMEMVIAITVFTVFIGASISTYTRFFEVEKEAAATRTLMMELQAVMDLMSQDLKDNKIDYDYYRSSMALDPLGEAQNVPSTARFSPELVLLSPDGEMQWRYVWDSFDEDLSLQIFDGEGQPLPGYMEPIDLNGPYTTVSHVSFRIFPAVDPFDLQYKGQDAVQFQPNVQIELEFETPSRVGNEPIVLDLQTSVTSRFYQ